MLSGAYKRGEYNRIQSFLKERQKMTRKWALGKHILFPEVPKEMQDNRELMVYKDGKIYFRSTEHRLITSKDKVLITKIPIKYI